MSTPRFTQLRTGCSIERHPLHPQGAVLLHELEEGLADKTGLLSNFLTVHHQHHRPGRSACIRGSKAGRLNTTESKMMALRTE
ncbi:hypothetical protein A3962_10535 [Meiothermus taiwanensis]|nr:hypothetical protein A3962_10535 [Meiothermus taiwanensis]